MKASLGPIASLLLAVAILLSGNGLQTTLVSVRANLEGFPISLIGLLMSAYYAGFVIGCFVCPHLVKRVGHIRTFTALAAIASATALLHVLLVDAAFWLFLRAIVGFCFAGLFMVIESWINEKATNENRGRVLSFYRIVDLSAVTLGQVLLTIADPAGFVLFCLISILVSCALVPVSLTTSAAPRPIHSTRVNVANLFAVSPLAAWAVLAAGLSNGAFWGLGPIFIQELDFGTETIAAFMSIVIIGGTLAQFPLGTLSDLFDRRRVLIAVALVGGVFSICIGMGAGSGRGVLLTLGLFYGAMALSHYSMAIAHANDRAGKVDFVELSSTLLLLFGLGAAFGPVIGATLMGYFGPTALFFFAGIVQIFLFVYGIIRMGLKSSVPLGEQTTFVSVPRSTPEIVDLDPRSGVDLETKD